MKTLRSLILICLAVVCCHQYSKSQTTLSMAGNEIIGMPDTVQYGDTLKNMTVWVKNDGILPTLNLLVTVNSVLNNVLTGQLLGNLNILGLLLPGDSVQVPLDNFIVTPQNSRSGANVVVVWPAAPGSQTGDSLQDGYYVKGGTAEADTSSVGPASHAQSSTMEATALDEPMRGPTFRIYPNPADDAVYLETNQPLVGEIRIFNLKGQLLHRLRAGSTRIELYMLDPGTYILELVEESGATSRKRFVKL